MLMKQCPGSFNKAVLEALALNTDRAQWATHTCELCNKQVGAQQVKGRWVTEQHWSSVSYLASNRRAPKITRSSKRSAEAVVLQSS
jgi:hypothetical protein